MKKDFFKDSKIKFPAYEPWISGDDKKIINKTLSQSMLTLGPQLEKFEADFCKYSKSKYAVAVSNCTAALHLSLMALGIAKDNDLKVVEDCAHAVGTFYKSKHVGTLGNTGCFSFYPTKNITTAEGGMVTTNSKEIAEKVRQLRSHGMTKSLKSRYSSEYPWVFDIVEPGYNYRLDEIRSALGVTQLKRIKKINELRKKASLYYHKNLQNIPGIILPDMVNDKTHSYHLYTIRVAEPFKLSRNQLYKKLKDNGIRTTVYWMPIHEYAAYRKFAKKSSIVNTTKTYDEILALPLFPNISKKHQDAVIKVIKSA